MIIFLFLNYFVFKLISKIICMHFFVNHGKMLVISSLFITLENYTQIFRLHFELWQQTFKLPT